jgi:hypothetical protein
MFIEYRLDTNTGESIYICEINSDRNRYFDNPEVIALIKNVLDKCPRIERHVVECAKMGDTKEFQQKLGTPPAGNLLKLENNMCGEILYCGTADKKECNTKNIKLKRSKMTAQFPICWNYQIGGPITVIKNTANNIANNIIHAWRENKYVIIVI